MGPSPATGSDRPFSDVSMRTIRLLSEREPSRQIDEPEGDYGAYEGSRLRAHAGPTVPLLFGRRPPPAAATPATINALVNYK